MHCGIGVGEKKLIEYNCLSSQSIGMLWIVGNTDIFSGLIQSRFPDVVYSLCFCFESFDEIN